MKKRISHLKKGLLNFMSGYVGGVKWKDAWVEGPGPWWGKTGKGGGSLRISALVKFKKGRRKRA